MVRILLQPILQAAVLPVEWVVPDPFLKQVAVIPSAVVPDGVDSHLSRPAATVVCRAAGRLNPQTC